MRITSGHIAELATTATSRAQSKVATATEVASSGLRVARPSDDPAAWAAAQRDKVREALASGTGAAIQTSTAQLEQTDGALATIADVVAKARQLAVQGASDTNANERGELGLQVQALFSAALSAANAQASDGSYVLAGAKTQTAPFDASGAYQGDATTRSVVTSEHGSDAVSVSGSLLTAANGVDVLPELAKLATALSTNDVAGIRGSLSTLTSATDQLSLARAHAGVGLAALSDADGARQALATHLTSSISNLVEADTVSSISDLSQATQALDVTRAVAANVVSVLSRLTNTGG